MATNTSSTTSAMPRDIGGSLIVEACRTFASQIAVLQADGNNVSTAPMLCCVCFWPNRKQGGVNAVGQKRAEGGPHRLEHHSRVESRPNRTADVACHVSLFPPTATLVSVWQLCGSLDAIRLGLFRLASWPA